MKTLIVGLILSISAQAMAGENLINFLKDCGWGAVIGAGAGAVTVAFENNPSDHGSNIARGASLGLYGGIAYGIIELNKKTAPSGHVDDLIGWVSPQFYEGRVEGANAHMVVGSF